MSDDPMRLLQSLLLRKWVLILSMVGIFPATAFSNGLSTNRLTLMIENRAEQPIRCTIVYAHFVSEPISLISEKVTLHFDRHTKSGVLSEQHTGRGMKVENIICGTNRAWQETASEILLLPMRDSTSRNFAVYCQFDTDFHCDILEDGF